MADLSKIKAPDGTEVDIKDATARSGLADKMDKANPTGTGSLSMNRKSSTTVGSYSVALGYNGTASGNYSTSLGNRTKAQGAESVAEGYSSTASGSDSHAEGYSTTASGASAHSEGSSTTASGNQSHAEGSVCTAAGHYSHVEGYGSSTVSAANGAHAEGYYTKANGSYSHAEGSNTTANGSQAHAEGSETVASGTSSHAEGSETVASGSCSHAEGDNTIAASPAQHAGGKYNIEDDNDIYAEIIGNGADDENRSNARTLDWDGNEEIAGNLKFMESSNTGETIPGIMWKEDGYGDKFEIRPRFSGTGDNNFLGIDAATGGAGTDPQVSTVLELHPSGGEILYGPAPTRNFKSTTIDMSKADNNVSSNTYVGSYYQDTAYRAYAKVTPVILPDGASILEIYAQNFDTSGASVGANTMQLSMDKSGNAGAYFSHPWALLEALGQYGGMKTGYIVWKNNCFIRQCGGDWSCFMLVDNSLYSICGGGGNHATMTPTLKLLAGDNMNVTQSITHSTNYSDFKYTSTSNHRWVVLSFSNNHNNHGIYYS